MTWTADTLMVQARCYQCMPVSVRRGLILSLLCQWANHTGPTPPPVDCDPVYENWKNRLIAAPGNLWNLVSQNTRDAVCEFCKDLRAAGIIDMMHAVNVVIPDDYATMLYPLIYEVGNGLNPWVELGGPNSFGINGLQGGGADAGTGYDTGFIAANQPELNDATGGISVYSCTEGTVPDEQINQLECGVNDTLFGTEFDLGTWLPLDSLPTGFVWNVHAHPAATDPNEIPAFVSINRTAVTQLDLYRANGNIAFALIGTSVGSTAGAALPTIPAYWMCINLDGVTDSWTRKTVSFVAIHEGLKQGGGFTQVSDLYDAVVKMRTSFGGGLYP